MMLYSLLLCGINPPLLSKTYLKQAMLMHWVTYSFISVTVHTVCYFQSPSHTYRPAAVNTHQGTKFTTENSPKLICYFLQLESNLRPELSSCFRKTLKETMLHELSFFFFFFFFFTSSKKVVPLPMSVSKFVSWLVCSD